MSNKETYDKKYETGYGLIYPDGHVIRFYERFLKYELGIDGSSNEKILDFGCGNGTHMGYFKSKGFDVYGVDVAESAIKNAKIRFPEFKSHIHLISQNDKLVDTINSKFDIIFSNQTLYCLTNNEFKKRLSEMYEMLNPGGLVYFTMMGTKNFYYSFSEPVENGDGLRAVKLKGRLNQTLYINFTNDYEELKNKFNMFIPFFIGEYDCSAREGSTYHFQFIGKKHNITT